MKQDELNKWVESQVASYNEALNGLSVERMGKVGLKQKQIDLMVDGYKQAAYDTLHGLKKLGQLTVEE